MIYFWGAISLLTVIACAAGPDSSNLDEGGATVAAINTNPESYVNREIVVHGKFMGWKGSCSGPPPVTRSDWMIEDKDQCIYVSGDLPVGLNALNPSGEKIFVKAKVKVNQTGKPYLVK
jgi:hypothetical protein